MNKNDHRRACIAHIGERFRHAANTLCGTKYAFLYSRNGWYDVRALGAGAEGIGLVRSFQVGNTTMRLSEVQDLVERMERRIAQKNAAST